MLPSLLPTTSVVLTADSALNLDNSTQTPAVKLDPVVSRESGAGNRVRINEPVKSQVDSIMETPAKPQPVSTWVSEKPETGWQVPVEQSISPDPTSGQDSALVRGSVELSCSGSEPDSGEESDCSDYVYTDATETEESSSDSGVGLVDQLRKKVLTKKVQAIFNQSYFPGMYPAEIIFTFNSYIHLSY